MFSAFFVDKVLSQRSSQLVWPVLESFYLRRFSDPDGLFRQMFLDIEKIYVYLLKPTNGRFELLNIIHL